MTKYGFGKKPKKRKPKRKTVRVKWCGIDENYHAIFRDKRGNYYGCLDKFFERWRNEYHVLKYVKAGDLRYFGRSFGCVPVGKWVPHKLVIVSNYKKRNLIITLDVLEGLSYQDAAFINGITSERVRQIVKKTCYRVNPQAVEHGNYIQQRWLDWVRNNKRYFTTRIKHRIDKF